MKEVYLIRYDYSESIYGAFLNEQRAEDYAAKLNKKKGGGNRYWVESITLMDT